MSEIEPQRSPDESQRSPDESQRWWTRVLPEERRGVVYAFLWLCCILLGYFIIRPVRETTGSIVGTAELGHLFTASFLVMIAAVPLYGWLVARLPRRWLVRVVFHFLPRVCWFSGC